MSTTDTSGNPLADYLRRHTNPPVFLISVGVVLAFLIVGVTATDAMSTAATETLSFITQYFGWFYVLATTAFLVFVIGLMISRYGRMRLGPDDSLPEYRTLPWFAMLFTAGMGIGLVFFGVYEAPYHMVNAPLQADGGQQAATEAMNLTIFHWGLHPWAIYIVLGLSLGYFCFRKGLPLRPASAFYPLIGDRVYGWLGNLIDILAVFGTMFGLATSLGLGAQQVNAGLDQVFGVPVNATVQVLIVAAITAVAVVSVMLGINRGIRRLSVINMWLALLLMLFVFAVGPKLYILTGLADYTGFYLQNILQNSFQVYSTETQADAASWQASWTLFYWGWWISWSPFVGMFIARISYGRTIRQFIGGTLFAPVGASIVWFSVLGGTGLNYQLSGAVDIAGQDPERAMFLLLDALPITEILLVIASLLAVVVVVLFFATSSDSGSLVIDMLTNGGDPHPIRAQRFFWAVMEGAVAAVLLWVGGETALTALQSASVTAGLPFAVVLVFMCIGMMAAFRQEPVAASASAERLAPLDARQGAQPARQAEPPESQRVRQTVD